MINLFANNQHFELYIFYNEAQQGNSMQCNAKTSTQNPLDEEPECCKLWQLKYARREILKFSRPQLSNLTESSPRNSGVSVMR